MAEYIANFFYSVIRMSTPLIFVALCSCISQQAGLLNMAAEAMMLTSSLAGVLISAVCQNVWLGILGGALCSVLIALFLCWATFKMKVDLYLMSISLNMALIGGTVFVVYLVTGTKASTAGVVKSLALGNINIPLIKNIPFIGTILSGHNAFTYIALLMVFIVWFLLFRTKLGLRIRASGQNPQAAESVGINPRKIYTLAFALAAFVGSFGGMYLSMGYQNFFIRNITANRGFIGLAAATIANGMPIGATVMSFVFGVAYAVTNYLKPYIVDQYFLTALPFILIIVMYFLMSWWRSKRDERLRKENLKRLEAERIQKASEQQA
jgi:simple sugar transport system permease protein